MIAFAFSGCSMSRFGRLESDKEIKHSFESYQVLPNHKYYYRGVSSKPTVIVGIEETYELNLKMWVNIDTGSDNYRRLINIVSLQGMGNNVEPWGFRILDKTGNYAGVWYSALRAAAVDINDNRQIVNLQPSTMVVRGEHQR
jgi:hypothetical protein